MKREGENTENEDVIDREVTENGPETNWDTLKEVIDKSPDDIDDEKKEKLLITKMNIQYI